MSQLIYLAGNVLQVRHHPFNIIAAPANDLTQGITILIVTAFIVVILRRANRLLKTADPTLQYPLLKPLFIQILITLGLFFIRLLVRIAEGAQGMLEGLA